MKIEFDSEAFENDFFAGIVKCNHFIAENCSEEPFYGLTIYVDSFDVSPGVYYNTESGYKRSLEGMFKLDWCKDLYKEKEKRWELHWSCGDWLYTSCGYDDPLTNIFDPIASKWIANTHRQWVQREHNGDWEAYGESILKSACRVAEHVESDESFLVLPKTSDFHIVVSDHDEMVIASYLRLEHFKANGIVLLPNHGIPHQIDYSAELARVVEAWWESDQ